MLTKEDFYKKLKNIPKAELHIHSEGVISKKTVLELLKRINPDDGYTMGRVDDLFKFSNLSEFVNIFLVIQKAFKEPEDFDILFEDMRTYFLDNGIIYSETFISPTSFIKNGLDFDKVIDRIVMKIRDIKEKDNIDIKLLIDVSRTFGHENAMNNLHIAVTLRDKYCEIIGIGLGGDESRGNTGDFADVFKEAKDRGLRVVAHAGESVGPESIRAAVELLKVERIGHGISSMLDKELIKALALNKIPLEVCPTSNIFTRHYINKIEDHPVREFYDSGVVVTINTDDPTFFGISLLDEYYNLYKELGFDLSELKEIIINGFQYSFMADDDKERNIALVNEVWDKHF